MLQLLICHEGNCLLDQDRFFVELGPAADQIEEFRCTLGDPGGDRYVKRRVGMAKVVDEGASQTIAQGLLRGRQGQGSHVELLAGVIARSRHA